MGPIPSLCRSLLSVGFFCAAVAWTEVGCRKSGSKAGSEPATVTTGIVQRDARGKRASVVPPAEAEPGGLPPTKSSHDAHSRTPASEPQLPPLSGISWTMEPQQLDVMRDTVVRLTAQWKGASPASFSCRWDPGDRTGEVYGCSIEHRFTGGLTDRSVTLTILYEGREVFTESRDLPLERLPVRELPPGPVPLADPPGPDEGIRVVFASLFAPPDATARKALADALYRVDPRLVLLFVNYEVSRESLANLTRDLSSHGARIIVPVPCNTSEGLNGPLDSRLTLHGKDHNPPYFEAFLQSSVLFVVLDPRVTSLSKDQEKWLLDHLEKGKVADHRVVVSCCPLESYTGNGSELQPQFRYYEKLLRGDVSLFISSSEPVYFQGSYGLIRTVSSGCAVGLPGRLPGTDRNQEHTFVVVDLVPDQPPAVQAVSLSNPGQVIDVQSLPRKLGNYQR